MNTNRKYHFKIILVFFYLLIMGYGQCGYAHLTCTPIAGQDNLYKITIDGSNSDMKGMATEIAAYLAEFRVARIDIRCLDGSLKKNDNNFRKIFSVLLCKLRQDPVVRSTLTTLTFDGFLILEDLTRLAEAIEGLPDVALRELTIYNDDYITCCTNVDRVIARLNARGIAVVIDESSRRDAEQHRAGTAALPLVGVAPGAPVVAAAAALPEDAAPVTAPLPEDAAVPQSLPTEEKKGKIGSRDLRKLIDQIGREEIRKLTFIAQPNYNKKNSPVEGITSVQIKEIATALTQPPGASLIEQLIFEGYGHNINDEAATAIARVLGSCPRLTHLTLMDYTGLGEGGKQIAEALGINDTLTYFVLHLKRDMNPRDREKNVGYFLAAFNDNLKLRTITLRIGGSEYDRLAVNQVIRLVMRRNELIARSSITRNILCSIINIPLSEDAQLRELLMQLLPIDQLALTNDIIRAQREIRVRLRILGAGVTDIPFQQVVVQLPGPQPQQAEPSQPAQPQEEEAAPQQRQPQEEEAPQQYQPQIVNMTHQQQQLPQPQPLSPRRFFNPSSS